MPGPIKPQRIRDPLHNVIEFGSDQLEHTLWQVIQTPPFQRLRRIRQLGFSEYVFPGATHTRFSHSIGVFHTARQLMAIIRNHIVRSGNQVGDHQSRVALAAALVHDVGHGMFSHAFEEIGKKLELPMARHETVSEELIRDSEISTAFRHMGRGFADDVADVIKRGRPGNLYDAVVSSQFDADRLDYMRRDRLMTGVRNSAIDFDWLMANLEIATVPYGIDEQPLEPIETFVLGPKASHAAETYVLALFQLYPTVYHHKTTRAAEKVFSALMLRLISLVRNKQVNKTGLPKTHPIARFAREADKLEHALALDDTVFWGALPMLAEAEDTLIRDCASRLRDRKLPKCIDIRNRLIAEIAPQGTLTGKCGADGKKRIDRLTQLIKERLEAWSDTNSTTTPRILVDYASRTPYKPFRQTTGPLNQILIRSADGRILDMAQCSSVVSGLETFELFRAYVHESDHEARAAVEAAIRDELVRKEDA
ncbi:HD domain-containing protein [Skermanella sp. TT6]|uniref:HD domain-containing protein n=1 Tax=Skermanella cutis TaxID=2775420 RepID=A0ABX7B3Z9_9PROT|nr:HD domain-containing protein [Skermanella sp. TT6]QQP89066.1 HD domain-containing protein [Skermanella sp. TT6]